MLFKLLPLQLLHLLQLPLLLMAAAGQPEYAASASATHRLAKRMDLEVCIGHFDVHKNTIIRTGESQAIGGKYLQGLELDTLEECERLCCETDACDVYIFERKSGGYCYLFECGPPENFHCKFTRHANYTSAVLTPQVRSSMELASTPRPQLPHIPSNNISQQEWELSNLKLKPEAQRDKPTIAIIPTAGNSQSVGVAQAALAAAAAAAPQSVPAPHCGRFQFSCHSGECIAVYNACDGIPQCEDGSDEGPECNAVVTKLSSNNNNNNNLEQYQPVPPIQQQLQTAQQQQQQQQQHVIVLGPPPPPPPPPPMVNNREDASAWANRKLITETQQQQQQQQQQKQHQQPQKIVNMDEQLNSHIFSHKGGLQLQQQQQQQQQPSTNSQGQVQGQPPPPAPLAPQSPQSPPQLQLPSYNTNNNAAPAGGALYGMSLPRTGIYLQQQQQQQQQPMPQQQQSQQVVNWPQVAAPPAQIAVQQPQQQSHAYITAAAVPAPAPAAAAPPPAPPAPPVQPAQSAQPAPAAAQSPQQAMLPVLNAAPTHDKNQAADEDYDDYEEDKSTEPPKKHKHKKVKGKTAKDPIELALEQNKQQQQQLPAPVGPVHEQYKLIHENLALEFRDHDGHSERPGGAVLSLTLGLLVTAALSILIGCRMRTVGRRARRMGGKTPYSQEADFLVNGMYL
ncbi:PREDICTED: putative uncharacterized protein DDB_G0271606 isoform X2 [Drosophila arizonae]|uniref:MANSC domain-containing protein n=1 Tax=Drosophila arizonae TaxID=7263 RepID=A0ABM1NZL4_DROAR|nr:PREDICTED: putative uncharacterized protein DDB_G0271606 isoform X2 [Drosophila arizonae]